MFNFKKIGGQILVLLMTLLCALDVNEAVAQEMCGDIRCGPGQFCQNGSCVSNSLRNASFVADGMAGKKDCDEGYQKVNGKCEKIGTGANQKQSASAVSGCSSNQGIFSGLIETGSKVFNGLRDLIYVVAGFGIIGVAVGGFFGNLNWKWLGAIVISLVVIATTGELISAITGCENFTNAMIADTLK